MLAAWLAAGWLAAADAPAIGGATERELIAVLQSGASNDQKAITCKRLAIYGTREAVPVLAPLAVDPELSSWARTALEAIPDPSADIALREAAGKAQGRILIGVLTSIGHRRDAGAVGLLTEKLNGADADVASAAAAALGDIGGDAAATALQAALGTAPAGARTQVADATVRCADGFLAAGRRDDAIKLYDAVAKAEVPKHKVLEATRAAILARQAAGLPLLIELLHSTDKATFGFGLRTARELPGQDVTKALIAEVGRATPEHQVLLVAVLGDRADVSALPALRDLAIASPRPVRLAAIRATENLGTVAAVPILLAAATQTDTGPAQSAKAALARLPGKEVDADLLARLPKATGRELQALIEAASLRRLTAALPLVVQRAGDPDPGVRGAAVAALGALGDAQHMPDLVARLEKSTDATEQAGLEKAILTISGREGAASLPSLFALSKSGNRSLRLVGLHALASAGGAPALAAVQAAANDADAGVQDEAVRTLCTWANNWPDDSGIAMPLLALARSAKKESHRALALQGYLQYLRGDTTLKDADKVTQVSEALPLLKTAEARRSAISVIGAVPTAGALELLTKFAAEAGVVEDACSALVNIAASKEARDVPADARRQALQLAATKSGNDATRKKAAEALRSLP